MPDQTEPRNPADLPPNAEHMVCAVCGIPLDVYQAPDSDVVEYIHGRPDEQADHIAVPVRVGEVPTASRCDFCDQPDTHIVVADSFTYPYLGAVDGNVVKQHSEGNWAACDVCANLVRRRAWGQLVTRVKSMAPPAARSVPRKVYVSLYEALEPNVREIITHEEWERRGRPR